ncbi:MAG: Hercynine oxygenase [Hyphomicrobiaceae bacterium hypho_1]
MFARDVEVKQEQKLSPDRSLRSRLFEVRAYTEKLTEPLSSEDQTVQAMSDASPTKWHLGHTTWFFEAFLLEKYIESYRRFDETFHFCFNSYYEHAGPRHPRPLRGMLTRPSAEKVSDYRRHVDEGLTYLFDYYRLELPKDVIEIIELGINHEQQHQELILTDILSLFASNPLRPAYDKGYVSHHEIDSFTKPDWLMPKVGIVEIGHDGEGFYYDNECPSHVTLLQPFKLCDQLVTNGDWLEFINDGAYKTPTLWLSDGWYAVRSQNWEAPGYWEKIGDFWYQMTLAGMNPVHKRAPVSNISYYEAEAFARWVGKRLPTEFEWEVAAKAYPYELKQLYSHVWQWTTSSYAAYPGFVPEKGAVGEYNGKFMCNQYVLRGASHATTLGHSRATYRNFFYADSRWQFTGLRLAENIT